MNVLFCRKKADVRSRLFTPPSARQRISLRLTWTPPLDCGRHALAVENEPRQRSSSYPRMFYLIKNTNCNQISKISKPLQNPWKYGSFCGALPYYYFRIKNSEIIHLI